MLLVLFVLANLAIAQEPSSGESDSLAYPIDNPSNSPAGSNSKGIDLEDPQSVEKVVVYDAENDRYVVEEKIGDEDYKQGSDKSFDEFWDDKGKEAEREYWNEKAKENAGSANEGFIEDLTDEDNSVSIFGSDFVEIKPQGSAEISFGVTSQKTENPLVRVENQRVTNIDFDQKIQLNVTGSIGEKLKISTNYNTEATFDFENQMKLKYEGGEDEIIKSVELGNVSLPLNSSLIRGSQNLFGVKSEMQFGKLRVTSVISQQRSDAKTIELSGGAQEKEVQINIDQYDDNRHFFLSQYFYNNYDDALQSLPVINSQIQITQLEVWITNVGISANQDARNIIGFMDLGERNPYDASKNTSPTNIYPSNNSNSLYSEISNNAEIRGYNASAGVLINNFGYESGVHFNKIENARRLNPSEYYFHPQLGFISMNRRMEADEVLAIAFQYTVAGSDQVYQVGEFSTDVKDVDQALFLKLLKSTQVNNTSLPLWDLMMKNVYSLGTYGVDVSTLDIDVFYNNPKTNNLINYLPASGSVSENRRWLEYMGVDKLDPQLNNVSDGRYDIVNGVTIRLDNGRIYFPSVEPFGQALRDAINDNTVADQFAFDSLYTTPKWQASNEFPDKNRFVIKARYQAQSSVINLNSFSIPQGAVTVTAGGRRLQEGTDFRVNYNTGQLTILNQSVLNSNTPIRVDVESNAMFNVMSKTLFGTHLEYDVSDDFKVGGTLMNLTERPLTQKNQQGSEPISNTIWGLNTSYKTESPYLTKLIDKIPFIDTKAMSTIQVSGEFAHLIPGAPGAIKQNGEAQSYIDAFEGGQTNINIANRLAWKLASTPQGQTDAQHWPEGGFIDELAYGFNRAKITWYNIDPIFHANNNNTPDHIRENSRIQGNHYQRLVQQNELFPNRDLQLGQVNSLLTFDVAYFPEERGPYNYDTASTAVSSGIDKNTGLLNDPESRWGGIMRDIDYVDFETRNIEFIEFWMMNPFENQSGDVDAISGGVEGGDLYFQIGNISEDILRDGRRFFENGLPENPVGSEDIDTTVWGRVSNRLNLVNAFDNDPDTRAAQDIGFDGLDNDAESDFFNAYLSWFGATLPDAIANDPSGDDYRYFRGDDQDAQQLNIIERYKEFNGPDGNSPTQEQTGLPYISTNSILPDIEDLNGDNTLSEGESYYQYKVSLRPEDLENSDIGSNYINQVYNTTVEVEGGQVKDVTWYQFRIPVRSPDTTIGSISDFQSIRFMRMMLKGWSHPVVLRFGTLDLVQSNWRQYADDLFDQDAAPPDATEVTFTLGSVNVEEDSKKSPVRYVVPPDIQRQFNLATQNFENEQALQLRVCDLDGGDARAIYKIENRDLLSYNKLKMDVHAEQIGDDVQDLQEMNMSVFLRVGSDFEENYYEYELPLDFTDPSLVSANNDDAAREEIWKNLFDFNYKTVFAALKSERNNNLSDPAVDITTRYEGSDGGNKVFVKGNPTMAQVQTIMIGVRNNNRVGDKRCAEVWVNELRLSEFDDQSGWATTGNVNMQLADLGNVSVGGGYSTPGWGSIDQKISERSRETIRNIDATGSFEMAKFFPEKYRLTIPMYLSYNRIRKDQQFNPLDTDIQIKDLENGSEYREQLEEITPEIQTSKSINFSNVKKKPKPGTKTKIYSLENFDATYAYAETKKQDVNTEFNTTKNYKGALNYSYKPKPKKIEPFKKMPVMSAIEKRRLAKMEEQETAIKDSIKEVRTQKNANEKTKQLNEELRDLREEKIAYKRKMTRLKRSPYLALYRDFHLYYVPQSFSVQTDMTRMFSERKIRNVTDDDLLIEPVFNKNWYFNRNYRLDYDLTRALKIDYSAKNQAFIDEPTGRLDEEWKQDSVWNSLSSFGRTTLFTQNTSINYKVPLNKFPWTNWITANLKYTGKYDWQAAPLSMDTLGNTISNNNTRQANVNMNMVSLYNKSDYLKKINRPRRRRRKGGKEEENDSTDSKEPLITGKDILETSLRTLMMIRNVSVVYSETNGTFIPGYTPRTNVIGMDVNQMAPGLGFVVGDQTDIVGKAIENGWVTTFDEYINQRVSQTNQKNLNWRTTLEPFSQFRVDVNGKYSETTNNSYFYRLDEGANTWNKFSPLITGQYSISVNTLGTSFSARDDDKVSNAFKSLERNRSEIAGRLAKNNAFSDGVDPITGFPTGYGETQEEVLLYSFLSAYRGVDPGKQNLSPFLSFPMPNWRVNYNGLMKLDAIKKYFDGVTLSHSYSSTYNFNGYQNNPNYKFGDEINLEDNFQSKWLYQSTTVSLQESFSPLIKIDMRFKNSVLGNIEFKKSRNISLNFSNASVVEQHNTEFVIGSGYTFKDLVIPIKIRGNKLKSDLDLKADLSIRSSNLTMLVIDGDATTTQGARIINININADYRISQKVTARLFYNQTVNRPFIATSFPNSTSSGGFSLRFTL